MMVGFAKTHDLVLKSKKITKIEFQGVKDNQIEKIVSGKRKSIGVL